MKNFLNFIREQGVVGLAIGFILGGAVSGLVGSLIKDIINPLIGLILGSAGSLQTMQFDIWTAHIAFGSFVSAIINFIVIAAVVYFGFKGLRLDKLDKPKA